MLIKVQSDPGLPISRPGRNWDACVSIAFDGSVRGHVIVRLVYKEHGKQDFSNLLIVSLLRIMVYDQAKGLGKFSAAQIVADII